MPSLLFLKDKSKNLNMADQRRNRSIRVASDVKQANSLMRVHQAVSTKSHLKVTYNEPENYR